MATRRAFLATLTGGLLAAPLAAEAQHPAKIYRIGVLSPDVNPPLLLEAFKEGLADRGYVEGKTVTLEWRHAGGRNERLVGMADELVRLRVDVIVAINTPAAHAAKNATRDIPIVITRVSDPVKTGLVPSFSSPGGNITGLSFQPEETSVKRLQLLKEAIPGVLRVAVLWYTGNPGPAITVRAIELASTQLGVEVIKLPLAASADLVVGFQAASLRRGDVLFVVDDVFLTRHRDQIVGVATKHGLPVVSQYKEFTAVGGLMAYGPSPRDMYHRTAYYVDRILKGARPSDLPIEQPTKYDLVINLKTAKALGLTIPPALLQRADEVIE